MTRQVPDDASTTDVVWTAAERIHKSSNAQDVNRICEYLISKHWFQTAGDLRVARANTQEWLALEVPSRLKIAIQEVLDASSADGDYSPTKSNANYGQASDSHSASLASEGASAVAYSDTTIDQSMIQSTEYEAQQSNASNLYAEQSGANYESGYSTSYDASYASASQDDPATAAAHAAAWAAYYAANGYYSYDSTEQSSAEAWNSASYPTTVEPPDDVVEAQEVIVEDAVVASIDDVTTEALEVPPPPYQYPEPETTTSANVLPPPPPYQYPEPQATTSTETWSCGQCTYINRIEDSFCEMCCGHYSLSKVPEAVAVNEVKSSSPAVPPDIGVMPMQKPSTLSVETAFSSLSLADTSSVKATRPTPLEPPLFVSIPSPSRPLSPLYSPSAPDLDDQPVKSLDLIHTIIGDNEKETEVSATAPVALVPPPPNVDYRALAFKRTTSAPSNGLSSPPRSSSEFSF